MFWEDIWEWKQVKRFVESDGRMKISVSLDLMVAMASRMDHPPWQFDATILCVRYAVRLSFPNRARQLAGDAAVVFREVDERVRDRRIQPTIDLFTQIGATDALKEVQQYIEEARQAA